MISFTHKKYSSFIKKALILFVLCAALFFFSGISNLSADSSDILICIDPGHGGRDPGAIGPTGLTEKEVNLDIAIRLKNRLRNAGYRVIMTRESDVYKSLQERVEIANNSGASVFVSIHNNAFTLPTPNGTETYYSTNSPSLSRQLAIDVHNHTLQQINTYNRGVKTADFYVLKNTVMISALLEGVFISNPTEEAKLRDASFREKIAAGVYNGIRDFLSSNDVVSYSASIDDLGNTPSRMLPGEQAEFNVKIKNNSDSFTWPADGANNVRFSYHIYDKYGRTVINNGLRTNLSTNLDPGESLTLTVETEAPGSSGTYIIEYDMVHEGITWFEDRGSHTLKKTIYVVDEECIAEYFINLYEELLLLTPDQETIDEAVSGLAEGSKTAGDVISELMASQEFIDRDLDNAGFVTSLYNAFFDREPDTKGYNYWLGKLNSGMKRNTLISYFIKSSEFRNICNDCDISVGSVIYNYDLVNSETLVTTITNSTNIVGRANATKEQLVQLFTGRNSSQTERAHRLADLYIYWGNFFNLRYDIAWAQMCHETGFLGYTGIVPPNANNFCGLGATGQKDASGNYVYNTFSSEELGVIAHYIHLAWYATPNCLTLRDSNGDLYCSTKYDPRHFGTAHNYNGNGNLGCLNTRWAPSSTYTGKIIQFANEIYN